MMKRRPKCLISGLLTGVVLFVLIVIMATLFSNKPVDYLELAIYSSLFSLLGIYFFILNSKNSIQDL